MTRIDTDHSKLVSRLSNFQNIDVRAGSVP